ncbi:MAG: PAS domain S-box protein [Actinomycetota bacterium]
MATDERPSRGPLRALRGAWRRLDRELPLLVKIGLPMVVITALGAVAVGSVLTERTTEDYRNAYRGQAEMLAHVVAAEYRASSGNNNPYAMGEFLSSLHRTSPLLDVVVYREDEGVPVAWASTPGPTPKDSGAEKIVIPVGTPTYPAWVQVTISSSQLQSLVARTRGEIVRVLLVASIGAIVAMSLVFYFLVLRRAGRLSRAARRVAVGDLSVHLPEGDLPESRDSLVSVAREFDRMVKVIRARTSELADAEARFRALVEQSPAAAYVRENDDTGTLSYISPQCEQLLGYTAEELLGQPDLKDRIISTEDRGRIRNERFAAARSGDAFRAEYRVTARDGRTVWIRDQAQLVPAGNGVERWQGILVDVTDVKQAQDALRRLDVQKESILDSAGEGIWGLGPDGRVTFVNAAAAQMTGWTAHELIGKGTHDLLHHTREDGAPYPEEECPIHAALTDGARHHVVGELFWRRDGSCFPTEYTSAPIFEDGHVTGAVVVFSDVTERERADDTLREAYEREREAAERLRSVDVMKNAFLSAVSHELRTPLSAVLGFATTLQQTDLELDEEDRKTMLDRLAANAHKLHQLLVDLLDLDRTARGVLEPQRSSLDLAELVLRVTEEAELGGHPVTVEAEPVLIEVDGPKVERIVENLVTNAAKYTPEGTPVRVRVRKQDDGVLIVVEDEGPGIPEALKEAVFEPFERGPDAPRRAAGTGIGLSLVARFAELHGGRAWVENRPSGGSSFRVFLPGVTPDVEAQLQAPAAAPALGR